MLRHKLHGTLRQRRRFFGILPPAVHRLHQLVGRRNLPRRTEDQRTRAGCLKIVHRRAEQHRLAARHRLDNVLAARIDQTAAHKHRVRQRIIREHFAHAVAHPHLRVWGNRFAAATFLHRQTQRLRVFRRRTEALRMPRHQHQQIIGATVLPPYPQYFMRLVRAVFFARAGRYQHAPPPQMPPPLRRQFDFVFRRRNVVFAVAAHRNIRRAQLPQPFRIFLGLRQAACKGLQRGADKRVNPPVAARRFFRQPRIGDKHRNLLPMRLVQQVRPQFGFHHHAEQGAVLVQELRHPIAAVIR